MTGGSFGFARFSAIVTVLTYFLIGAMPSMSDEILLYLVLLGMLMLAVGMLIPSLMRIGQSADNRQAEDEAYGEEVVEAFRRQLAALDEERRKGAITEVRWQELSDDIRRRMLEEHDAVFHDPNATALSANGHVSRPLVLGCVVVGMVALSVGFYAAKGAPELIELEKAQHVLSGQAATPDIEHYLAKNSKDGRAWVLLAHRYVESGTYDKALEAYRNACRVNTKVANDPTVMLELAATLVTVGGDDNFKEAQPIVEKALEKLPGDNRALELLALTATANQDWKTAADTVARLLEGMSPDTPTYMRYEATLKRLRELAAKK